MTQSATLLLISAFGVVAAEAPPGGAFTVREHRASPGHARVLLAPRDTTHATTAILFSVGSYDDGRTTALTAVSLHALLEANDVTATAAFHNDLHETASTLVVRTGYRESSIILTARREHFQGLAERLLRLLLAPRLNGRGLARAKALADADEVPTCEFAALLDPMAGAVMALGVPAGPGEMLLPPEPPPPPRPVTVADVERHVLHRLAPTNATVVFAGAFEEELLVNMVDAAPGGMPVPPLNTPGLARRLPLHLEQAGPDEVWVHAVLADLRTPRNAAAAHVLAEVLDARATARLRREGVTQRTFSRPVAQEWLDGLVTVVPLARAQGVRPDDTMRQLVASLRAGDLKDEEFQRMRGTALAQMERADLDSAALASELSVAPGRVRWHDAEVARELGGMNRADFLDAIRPWLADNATVDFRFGRRDAAGSPP